MDKSVKLTLDVYSKIFLHAAKYSDSPVLGYLIGNTENKEMLVSAMLPVAHSYPSGPIFEIAADVAEKTLQPNTKIVGIYYSNDRVDDNSTPIYISRLAEGIKRITGECLVVQVKNSLLASKSELFLESKLFGQSKILPSSLVDSLSTVNNVLDKLLSSQLQFSFSDFEDHLNGGSAPSTVASVDFRNQFVNSFISKN